MFPALVVWFTPIITSCRSHNQAPLLIPALKNCVSTTPIVCDLRRIALRPSFVQRKVCNRYQLLCSPPPSNRMVRENSSKRYEGPFANFILNLVSHQPPSFCVCLKPIHTRWLQFTFSAVPRRRNDATFSAITAKPDPCWASL